MAAQRKATPDQYKFVTLTSYCGEISQAEFTSIDDTFHTVELAQEAATSRFNDDGDEAKAIYIVEVHGVVKPNKAYYTPLGTQSLYEIEGS